VIVVDTHAVIWMTQEPAVLSAVASRALLEARKAGELGIADVTLREIAYLVTRKRVMVSRPLDVYLGFVESIFRVLPMNGKIAQRSTQFGPIYPNDPTDQIIGATAVVLNAALVTRDEKIRASGEVECIW
jgi:PIN domain nuclease of toxin-antitoxin system